jgi:hypothetical protein
MLIRAPIHHKVVTLPRVVMGRQVLRLRSKVVDKPVHSLDNNSLHKCVVVTMDL